MDQSLKREQDPEKLTPPAPKIDVQDRRPEMTSPDDTQVRIQVKRIVITGHRPSDEAALYAVLPGSEGYAGWEMTLAELKACAAAITSYYRKGGFALTFAYVPAQDIKEGIVELQVVAGRIDKVLLEGNGYYTSDFILNHVGRLQRGHAMRLDDLERSLYTLNDYPGLSVRATLRQGDTPGATDLYLTAEDRFPVMFMVDYDNYGSENVGRHRVGMEAGAHNLWEEGHSLSIRGVSSLDSSDGELLFGRATYVLPLNSTGGQIVAYGSMYDYEAKGPLTSLQPTGSGEVYGWLMSQPFQRGHEFSLTTEIGMEVKNLEQQLLGFTTGEDHLRILVAAVRLEWTDPWWGRWVANGTLRQGLGEFMNGMGDDDPDASRLNADGDFTKLSLTVYRLQKIWEHLHLVGKIHTQWAQEPLVVSEQIAIGGHDSVRGYPSFEFMGDRGYAATAEARFTVPWMEGVADPFNPKRTLKDVLQVAAFMDIGEGMREEPAFGERERRVLSGAGVGFRLNYLEKASVRFDMAWPMTDHDPSDDKERVAYVSVIVNLN